MSDVAAAIADGVLPGRLWLYANYHCNLACTYCLTESAPSVSRRELPAERMVSLALEARTLGFTDLGITGGEPFMVPTMWRTVVELAGILPLLVLSNATLFDDARAERLRPLSRLPAAIQVSLDHHDAAGNDEARGPGNWAKVVDGIRRLVERGIRVRVASTLDPEVEVRESDRSALCELHRSLGIDDDDHVVRPVVRRGRARAAGIGVDALPGDLPPELTITADGAFWSPFGPTIRNGELDTDLLVTRTTTPLERPAAALARLLAGGPPTSDAQLGIR